MLCTTVSPYLKGAAPSCLQCSTCITLYVVLSAQIGSSCICLDTHMPHGKTSHPVVQEKVAYKEAFARLRELKQEIEHLQMLLEQSRSKLQKDFEQWMTLMLRQQQAASAVTAGALTGGNISAFASPSTLVHRYYRSYCCCLSNHTVPGFSRQS